MTSDKLTAIKAQLAALAAELDALTDTDTDKAPAGPGVEVTNATRESDRDEPKPTPHTKADGIAEAQRRFPNRSSSASDEDVDTASEPVQSTGMADGRAEAARRFGLQGGARR